MPDLPEMVKAAQGLSQVLEYKRSISNGLGPFLQVLASTVISGRLLVLGAGTGVASAWIIDRMSPYVKLVAYEPDPRLAKAATDVVGTQATVVTEPPETLLKRGPFAFAFINLARTRISPLDVLEEMTPGALIVIGNLDEGGANHDLIQEWRDCNESVCAEIMVGVDEPALVISKSISAA